jgi:hypothetical protein
MPYLIEVTITRPTITQLRCATAILSRDGMTYRLTYSPDCWNAVKPKEEVI